MAIEIVMEITIEKIMKIVIIHNTYYLNFNEPKISFLASLFSFTLSPKTVAYLVLKQLQEMKV